MPHAPVVIRFRPVFLTWRALIGQVRCAWRRDHDWQESHKGKGRTLTCSRCRDWICIVGEQEFVAFVEGNRVRFVPHSEMNPPRIESERKVGPT